MSSYSVWSSSQLCIYTQCCPQHLFIFYSIISSSVRFIPVHSICLSCTRSYIFPITWCAISSSVRFIPAFTEPSWFLHHVQLVAGIDNLASQILASFLVACRQSSITNPGLVPRLLCWPMHKTQETRLHKSMNSLHACGIKKTNPMHLYLQQLNLTGTVWKVFNLVQNHTGTIPKQF